jgi:hypothetical protein
MWTKGRWFALGAVVGVIALVMWSRSMGSGTLFADLVDHFPTAMEARPNREVFVVGDVTIAGRTLKSISVSQGSRIKWKEPIPSNAWLEVSLGVREEAWTKTGDGVLFLVGISHPGKDGKMVYDELVSLIVNPFGNPADRQWYPLMLDLSPYAGQEVEVIFNTRPGAGAEANADNDLAVWGAPSIVTR